MKVKFVPQNIEAEITSEKSVLHLAQDNNLYIKSVCRGVPACAECRVRVIEGVHNVVPPGSEELQLIGTAHFVDGRRLSCQLKCFGDITVDLSEQVEKEKSMTEHRGQGSKSVREAKAESSAVFGNLFEGFKEREERNDNQGGQSRNANPNRGGNRDGGNRDSGSRGGGGNRDGGNRQQAGDSSAKNTNRPQGGNQSNQDRNPKRRR